MLLQSLSAEQVATLCSVSVQTVRNWKAQDAAGEGEPVAGIEQSLPWRDRIEAMLGFCMDRMEAAIKRTMAEDKDIIAQARLAKELFTDLQAVAQSMPATSRIDADELLAKAKEASKGAEGLRLVS